jgi:MFS family permease
MHQSHSHEKTIHRKLAWVVTITSALFFFYAFIQMNLFNSINTQLREAFQLDAVQLGQLFSMYFYANFLFLFPAGNVLDRFSTKKLLVFAIVVSTLGTGMFSVATTYWMAAVGRFLVGAGASFCFLSCIRIASRWFPPSRMALVSGVVVTMAMLGGLVAQTPFTFLIDCVGSWRTALLLNTGLGVLILLATIFIVKDHPPDAIDTHADHQRIKELGLWHCIRLAALNPQNWLGGLYTSLMNLPVFVIGGLWGILYLTGVHHITMEQASYATTIFFVGVIFGCLVFGWVSDHIERRVLPMYAGAVLSLATICILMFVPNLSFISIVTLFFLVGFVTSSQVLTYPTIAELNPSYLTSTAVSIDSMCIMASGFIAPPIFGWLMERNSTHEMVNGVVVYSAESFNHAMLIMPASFIAALVIAFFIRETYCRSQA